MARTKKGFTLVEMCTVVAVIAMLASLAYMQFRAKSDTANQGAATANLNKIRSAINSYFNDTGLYPTALTDLTASAAPANGKTNTGTTASLDASSWHGPYLSQVDVEPVYGTSYTYTSQARGSGVYYTVNPVNWN